MGRSSNVVNSKTKKKLSWTRVLENSNRPTKSLTPLAVLKYSGGCLPWLAIKDLIANTALVKTNLKSDFNLF